jgi:hypothetical protein
MAPFERKVTPCSIQDAAETDIQSGVRETSAVTASALCSRRNEAKYRRGLVSARRRLAAIEELIA